MRRAMTGTRVRPAPTLRQVPEAAVSALWRIGRGRLSSRVPRALRALRACGGGAPGASSGEELMVLALSGPAVLSSAGVTGPPRRSGGESD